MLNAVLCLVLWMLLVVYSDSGDWIDKREVTPGTAELWGHGIWPVCPQMGSVATYYNGSTMQAGTINGWALGSAAANKLRLPHFEITALKEVREVLSVSFECDHCTFISSDWP